MLENVLQPHTITLQVAHPLMAEVAPAESRPKEPTEGGPPEHRRSAGAERLGDGQCVLVQVHANDPAALDSTVSCKIVGSTNGTVISTEQFRDR